MFVKIVSLPSGDTSTVCVAGSCSCIEPIQDGSNNARKVRTCEFVQVANR